MDWIGFGLGTVVGVPVGAVLGVIVIVRLLHRLGKEGER